ncbi:uncharacterized protein LOC131613171 [Vicia villosa]|uniref:uncharacterized protein LOC131613171 n=1 Tax=Vicia villosa TaxID=3911 RepID=UPI00273B0A8F|nr:uncharacterized protein LOC131613171 [Vicia villosa]
MVHPDNCPEALVMVPDNVDDEAKSEEVKDDNNSIIELVDVRNKFTKVQVFNTRNQMLDWIRMEAIKLGFGIVIGRSDNDNNSTQQAFVTMVCERGGNYFAKIWKYKHEYARTRKCGYPFKLRGYLRVDGKCRLNVICGLHNHALDNKLHGHPSVSRLKSKEKVIISYMSVIKVMPRNILADCKRKRPDNVSNIKQVYNAHYLKNMEIRGPRAENRDATTFENFG